MEVRFKAQKTMLFGWTGDTSHAEWLRLIDALETAFRNSVLSQTAAQVVEVLRPAELPEFESASKAATLAAEYERSRASLQIALEGSGALKSGRESGAISVIVGSGADDREQWIVPGSGKTNWFKDFEQGPEMVVVPAGKFTMESNNYDSEKPPHLVTIAKPFAVGRFPITFAEWDAAGLPHKPGDAGWGRGRRPVINVSWDDAKAYVAWLSKKTAKAYRLLSEAEWEYGCRAMTTTKYAFGDTISKGQAHYSEGKFGSAELTVEAGKYLPNSWGLHDMHGNVWEWCKDAWHPNYDGAPQDGSVWMGGDASLRVLRGGSWRDNPVGLRSANRGWLPTGIRCSFIGFRLARTL